MRREAFLREQLGYGLTVSHRLLIKNLLDNGIRSIHATNPWRKSDGTRTLRETPTYATFAPSIHRLLQHPLVRIARNGVEKVAPILHIGAR